MIFSLGKMIPGAHMSVLIFFPWLSFGSCIGQWSKSPISEEVPLDFPARNACFLVE